MTLPSSVLRGRRLSAVELAWLALTTTAAAFLRFHGLGEGSLWADELIMLITARRPFFDGLVQLQDYSAPLYQLMLRALVGEGRPSELLLRAPAALFGTACVPAGWWLARLLFGAPVAAAVALVLALDPTLVDHAREARPNSLFVLLSLLSTASLWLLVRRGSQVHALGWVSCSTALVYAHYLGFACLAGQALWLCAERALLRRPRAPRLLAAAATCVAISALPALGLAWRYAATGAPGTVGWIPRRDAAGYLHIAAQLLGLAGESRTALSTVLGGAAIALAAGALARAPAAPDSGRVSPESVGSGALLCAAWIVAALLAFYPLALVYRPLLTVRYALPVAAPLALAALACAAGLHRGALALVTAALVALGAPSLPRVLRPNAGVRELAQWLEREVPRGAPLFVANWAYCPGFVNPELAGLAYYGFERPGLRMLELQYPHDVRLRDPQVLGRPPRAYIVAFLVPARHIRSELLRRGWRVQPLPFGLTQVLVVSPP